MCGDSMCPTCGPAQGYDPQVIEVSEWIADCLWERLQSSPIDILIMSTIISEEIAKVSPDVFNSMLFEAKSVTYKK
jgi:hypothetical protein